jgi:hypothetical protein
MTRDGHFIKFSTLIHDKTRTVAAYMEDNGIPESSFGLVAPPVVHLPPEIDGARNAAL